jgi:hypothetical protein
MWAALAFAPCPLRAGAIASKNFTLVIAIHPRPGTTLPNFSAEEGETVLLSVSAPVDGFLNVHGLADEMAVSGGKTTDLQLVARSPGRFPVHFHAHGLHMEIAVLQVWPK